MKGISLSVKELVFIAGTRAALGVGIGLLLADKLARRRRRATGWTLAVLGALTTIPAASVLRRRKAASQRVHEPTAA